MPASNHHIEQTLARMDQYLLSLHERQNRIQRWESITRNLRLVLLTGSFIALGTTAFGILYNSHKPESYAPTKTFFKITAALLVSTAAVSQSEKWCTLYNDRLWAHQQKIYQLMQHYERQKGL